MTTVAAEKRQFARSSLTFFAAFTGIAGIPRNTTESFHILRQSAMSAIRIIP